MDPHVPSTVETSQSLVSPRNPAGRSPHIAGVTPSTESVGNTVVISGSGFGTSQKEYSYVSFGGVDAGVQIEDWSDTKIGVKVPNDAHGGYLTVGVNGHTASVPFTIAAKPAKQPANQPQHKPAPAQPKTTVEIPPPFPSGSNRSGSGKPRNS